MKYPTPAIAAVCCAGGGSVWRGHDNNNGGDFDLLGCAQAGAKIGFQELYTSLFRLQESAN